MSWAASVHPRQSLPDAARPPALWGRAEVPVHQGAKPTALNILQSRSIYAMRTTFVVVFLDLGGLDLTFFADIGSFGIRHETS